MPGKYKKDKADLTGRTRAFFAPTPEILSKIEALAAQGLWEQDIARCLDIGPQTFSDKKITFPVIEEAIKKGRAKGISVAANELFKKIKEGNLTAIIFFLKCVGKWREYDPQNTMTEFYGFMHDLILYVKTNNPKAVEVIEGMFDDFMRHARNKYEVKGG